jgi:hypothetical protein
VTLVTCSRLLSILPPSPLPSIHPPPVTGLTIGRPRISPWPPTSDAPSPRLLQRRRPGGVHRCRGRDPTDTPP